jgi:putative DNA primase/helicase
MKYNFPQDYNPLTKEVYEAIIDKKRDKATELLADAVKQLYSFYTTRHDELPEVWVFSKGIYIPEGKTYIKEFCRRVLERAYTEQIANAVISKVCVDTFIEVQEFFNHNEVSRIVCENGILDLKEKTLDEYEPSEIHFTKIPVEYDTTATCPNIDKFLLDVLGSEEDKQAMYELFGYCLWKDAFLEQAVMCIGSGRNGKDKTLELLKRFLGEENTKGIPLQTLEEQDFAESELFGKLANLAGELSNKTLDNTSKFKAITGRSLLSASRKFKTKIEFVNFSKQIFATNTLPKTNDTSNAFWERWIYFRFPYTFKSQEELNVLKETKTIEQLSKYKLKNPEIIKQLITPQEFSGLLNKSIEGLHRVLENKHFTKSQNANDIMEFWVKESDSFLAFCMDFVEQDIEGFVTKESLRKRYQKYCKENKVLPEGDKRIKYTLAKQYGSVEDRKVIHVEDGQVFVWDGISIKETKKDWSNLRGE